MEEKVIELEERVAALERLLRGTTRIEADVLYSVAEATAFLGCGLANTYSLLTSGELAKTPVGAGKKGIKVRGSDLLAFLDARREGGPRPQGSFKFLKSR